MYFFTKDDLDYFERGKSENPKFWTSLGEEPNFFGKKILDIGCGHGSLCVYMASKGAKQVIGIDLDQQRIEFANNNVVVNYPHLKESVKFYCCEIADLQELNFDIIVSKDAFEHILNLYHVVDQMYNMLKEEGKAFVAIAPLYNSPFGDHGRTKALLPWGHLFFPESFLLRKLKKNKGNTSNIMSIYDLGLNKFSLANYRKLFYKSKLTVLSFRINVSYSLKSKLFSSLRWIPFCGEYFSHNLYCILKKTMV